MAAKEEPALFVATVVAAKPSFTISKLVSFKPKTDR